MKLNALKAGEDPVAGIRGCESNPVAKLRELAPRTLNQAAIAFLGKHGDVYNLYIRKAGEDLCIGECVRVTRADVALTDNEALITATLTNGQPGRRYSGVSDPMSVTVKIQGKALSKFAAMATATSPATPDAVIG